jgi:hypothetical protein
MFSDAYAVPVSDEVKTVVSDDGKRYKSKPAGSLFIGLGGVCEMRSCLFCSEHMPRHKGRIMRRYSSFVCYSCRPEEASEQGQGKK